VVANGSNSIFSTITSAGGGGLGLVVPQYQYQKELEKMEVQGRRYLQWLSRWRIIQVEQEILHQQVHHKEIQVEQNTTIMQLDLNLEEVEELQQEV
jgi:hypothetical protein